MLSMMMIDDLLGHMLPMDLRFFIFLILYRLLALSIMKKSLIHLSMVRILLVWNEGHILRDSSMHMDKSIQSLFQTIVSSLICFAVRKMEHFQYSQMINMSRKRTSCRSVILRFKRGHLSMIFMTELRPKISHQKHI